MLPEIGVMIGAYVIVRMLDLIFRRLEPRTGLVAVLHILNKVAAGITIVVAIVIMVDLVLRGTIGLGLQDVK